MRLHVEALFTHTAEGLLEAVNEPGGGPAPRFFIGRTREGPVLRFRHDVDPDIRRALELAASEDATAQSGDLDVPTDPTQYRDILALAAAVEKSWAGPAYWFPNEFPSTAGAVRVTDANAKLLEQLMRGWLGDVSLCQPMFALPLDERAVALCCSVRQTAEAHEAGVETVAPYRGRGYAARVTAAWAGAVRAMGRVPLYSTSWQNEASRAVARKLGLIRFGNDLHIT